jgi:hypothetical protein
MQDVIVRESAIREAFSGQRKPSAPPIDMSNAPYGYQTAADGKESKTVGSAWRAQRRMLNYL